MLTASSTVTSMFPSQPRMRFMARPEKRCAMPEHMREYAM
jgi:hypothetical protein